MRLHYLLVMCTMASKAAPLRKASSGSLNTLQQGNPEDNQAFDEWKMEGPWKMRMDGQTGRGG